MFVFKQQEAQRMKEKQQHEPWNKIKKQNKQFNNVKTLKLSLHPAAPNPQAQLQHVEELVLLKGYTLISNLSECIFTYIPLEYLN